MRLYLFKMIFLNANEENYNGDDIIIKMYINKISDYDHLDCDPCMV